METSLRPSIGRIILNDYPAFLTLCVPAALWVVYVIGMFRWDDGTGVFLYVAAAAAPIGVALLLWRVQHFKSLFEQGQTVTGHIRNIRFYRDRGRIEFSFVHNGQTFTRGNAVMRTRQTRSLRSGEDVVLIFDPADPRRAIVRDLYV